MRIPPSSADIFLSPHSDDICFSLGVFASRRQAGQLLTVFPRATYQVRQPSLPPQPSMVVTRRRIAEDGRFALASGLEALYLGFADATTRGGKAFDAAPAPAVTIDIASSLLAALEGPALGMARSPRPLLACPAGIGGHVDHLAVCRAVVEALPQLEPLYQVGFYEDLHYASDAQARGIGLRALAAALPGRRLTRVVLPLDAAGQARKMQLVGIHQSQLTPRLRSIAAFTPATGPSARPHEAIWMLQPAMHQASG